MRLHTLSWVVLPVAAELSLSSDPSPVQRVVKLLNEMKDDLAEETKKDEKLFKDLECWCNTNRKNKTKAIADGQAKVKTLDGVIKSESGKEGAAAAAHKIMKEKVENLQADMATAESDCETDLARNTVKERELVQTVTAVKSAVTMLSKHHEFLQKKPSLLQSVQSVIHYTTQESKIVHGSSVKFQHSFLQAGFDRNGLSAAMKDDYQPVLTFAESARALTEFLQTKQPAGGYQSQSGGILGMLQGMLDDFSLDLKETQKAIKQGSAGCKNIRQIKEKELAATREEAENQRQAESAAAFAASQGKTERTATNTAVATDQEVLQGLETKCQGLTHQKIARRKERDDETEAINKAIGILIDDGNREALHGSFFLQTSSSSMKARVHRRRNSLANIFVQASRNLDDSMLDEKLRKRHQTMLTQAAMKSRLDAFQEVKTMIRRMVDDIQRQMKADVDAKESCRTDIQNNDKALATDKRLLVQTNAKIESDQASSNKLTDEIAEVAQRIQDTKFSIQKASANRAEENADNVKSATEQQAMHDVLNKAYFVLKDHYAKKAGLLQTAQPSGLTDSPGEIDEYKQNSKKGGLLAMFEKIMTDCNESAAASQKADAEAQAEYEKFVTASNQSVQDDESLKGEKESELAGLANDIANGKTKAADVETNVSNLETMDKNLHNQCDFLQKYFTVRQKAMQAEIDACKKATAILSGSSEGK